MQKADLNIPPSTPNRLYMMKCRELGTNPEPVISKLMNGIKLDGGFSLRNMGLGAKQIEALSDGIGATFLRHIDLYDNRISNPSATKILRKLDPSLLQKVSERSTKLLPPIKLRIIHSSILHSHRRSWSYQKIGSAPRRTRFWQTLWPRQARSSTLAWNTRTCGWSS